jgi:hypothetical protein
MNIKAGIGTQNNGLNITPTPEEKLDRPKHFGTNIFVATDIYRVKSRKTRRSSCEFSVIFASYRRYPL